MFDFLFNKIVFNYRHWFLPTLVLVFYKVVTILGDAMIKRSDMPDIDSDRANEPIFFLIGAVIITSIFLLCALFTKIKYWLFKKEYPEDPKHLFLNSLVKNAFFDTFENTIFNDENADVSNSEEGLEVTRGEAEFMKEVVRSYAFRDSGLEDNVPELEFTIKIRPPTPKGRILTQMTQKDLLSRIKYKTFYKEDIEKHVELMDVLPVQMNQLAMIVR